MQYLCKPIRIFEITRKLSLESFWQISLTMVMYIANILSQYERTKCLRNVSRMQTLAKVYLAFSLVVLKVFNSIIRHYTWWYYKFMRYQHVLRTTWLRNQFSYNPKWILTSYIRKITVLRIKLIVRDGMKIWKRHTKNFQSS